MIQSYTMVCLYLISKYSAGPAPTNDKKVTKIRVTHTMQSLDTIIKRGNFLVPTMVLKEEQKSAKKQKKQFYWHGTTDNTLVLAQPCHH